MRIELSDPETQAPGKRQLTRVKADSKQVVLCDDSGEHEQGEVIDESFGGIGLSFPAGRCFQIGEELEVSYGGVQLSAVVRHATVGADACRVGLEWKAVGLSRAARQSLTATQGQSEVSRFKSALPSGFYMMWRLLESEQWVQLAETADRLRRLASKCDFVDAITSYVEALEEAVAQSEPAKATRQALVDLIDACVRVTAGGAEPCQGGLATR